MSADSPNHTRPELLASSQNIVTPQPVTDPTILDSVAGFINEVVPTTGSESFDSKDQIQWARFENLDFDESNFSPTVENALPSSLILVLGYSTGLQVWAVPANGEAIELFSWRHGSIRVLRILPGPYDVGSLNKRDQFETKRPLIALVDVSMPGSNAGSLNFYSLKTGEQVKSIKFKTQILDVFANRHSVVITFAEKIAIFDAFTLEDKLSVTSCYLSPGIQPNPVALGPRWLAFAEKKLVISRRSSGGTEGEGVQSYTATVLHAAKSLGRGLRELGDAVASSLTGNQGNRSGTSPNSPQAGGSSDVPQKGVVTILDLESPATNNADGSLHPESIVAHFVAHTEAIVWLQFGPCGMLLLTADKRGHDFNLFRINPHPVGSALAAVHHLYTLHRGDTSARVQDMCFSFDSRWVTVSTLRGTTHVFPITPYGGNIGFRTHTTPHVVNKMSRFHRSAGLTSEGRSNSPVSTFDSPVSSNFPYHNPRFSPFPHPTVVNALAQLRQPVYMQNIGNIAPRQGRQRLTSSSEDNIALRVTACFAPARAWIDSTIPAGRETGLNKSVKPVESLFIMNCHGTLVQYDLDPHHASGVPKERVCDDTPVELTVTAKAQWRLQRHPASIDRPLPLPRQSLVFVASSIPLVKKKMENGNDDDWLSQVEIITHAGPHRRLWMGPQFTFKTYTTTNGTPMSLADAQPLDLNRSKPVNMPITKANAILIESSSASSSEQSLLDIYRKNCEEMGAAGEHQIREDLADAMIESPGTREAGGRCVLVSVKSPPLNHVVAQQQTTPAPVANVVNPLGTVVTVQSDDDETEALVPEDIVIYENCDETLFRPLVTPKTVAYCRSSKADGGNIMTQSLRGDTNVTVRVMDKGESFSGGNWDDPRMQDIKTDTKVIVHEGEIRDLLVQEAIQEAVSEPEQMKNDNVRTRSSKSAQNEIPILEKTNIAKQQPEIQSGALVPASSEVDTSKNVDNDSRNKPMSKKSTNKKLEKPLKVERENPEQSSHSTTDYNESSLQWPYPLHNDLDQNKSFKSETSRKSKTNRIIEENVETLEQNHKDELDSREVSFTLTKTSSRTRRKPKTESLDIPLTRTSSNSLLKELGTVEEISFPALDSKLDNTEFPPLEENFFSLENLAKTEKYEDAEDCGLPVEPIVESFYDDKKIELFSSNIEDNSIDEVDDKLKKRGSLRKTRKPKVKLGVKIATTCKEDSPDRVSNKESSFTEVATEITLPVPKRSWSSIAASKPSDSFRNDPWVNNSEDPPAECYTITLPNKSDVTTEKLLDIDSPEECSDNPSATTGYLLDIEKSGRLSGSDISTGSADLLKISDRWSDDDKNESGSTPIESTESSDEGKCLGKTVENFDVKDKEIDVRPTVASKKRLRRKK